MELDLGIKILNRKPYAKEVFKLYDLDLLPHSDVSTLLGEIFEWRGRTWRTTGKNVIGFTYPPEELAAMEARLKEVPRNEANVPDFEMTKKDIIELGGNIPALFKIKLKGKYSKAKQLSVEVNEITKARLTNYQEPGVSLRLKMSEYAQKHPKAYRRWLKNDHMSIALFYAASVVIKLERGTEAGIDLEFDPGVEVTVSGSVNSVQTYTLRYTGNACPFAATMMKGRNFVEGIMI